MDLKSDGRLKGAILLGVASLLWMFGPKAPLDHYYPPKNQMKKAVASHSTREVAAEMEDLSTPPPKNLDRSTSKVIRQCLKGLDQSLTAQRFSLKELADHLRNSRTAATKIEVQNLHLLTPEGKQLRLMISPSDSSEFVGLEAQLFSVDSEGLPVAEELPLSIQARDIGSAKNYFLNLGTVTFSETTYLYKDEASKIAGKLSYSFDEVVGAELSQNGRFLGCSKSISSKSTVCTCL